ncbi:unnamed protein product [Gulo gulo]|uniref:Uncharacterized protein n=1 Tax=Gulo gulo TaxID=48420 RepID=A0A9X9Q3X1_GULGU|nr:unnamed protein product [Gulo gulo]
MYHLLCKTAQEDRFAQTKGPGSLCPPSAWQACFTEDLLQQPGPADAHLWGPDLRRFNILLQATQKQTHGVKLLGSFLAKS